MKFQRSTKKYCNDNCKQLAYYIRQGQSLSAIPAENPALSVKPEEVIVKEPLTVKQDDFTISPIDNSSGIIDKNELESISKQEENIIPAQEKKEPEVKKVQIEVHKETAITVSQPQKEEPYESEDSEFIYRIRELINLSDEEDKFAHPKKYWHPNDLPYIKWVTVRARCLLESVIKISNSRHIDRQTLLEVADAFKCLVSCDYFKWMPQNYPCTKWITELNEKIQAFAIANNDCEIIRFRISPERKAELIAKRFLIGNFAAKIKFSELNFETALDKIS